MTQNYDERFQERVDELLFLENKVEEHIKSLANMNEHYRKVYEAVTKDISQKMMGVNESLKKINEGSEKISDYMAHCEKHAEHTRSIFMATVLACVIVIAGTFWWSYHINDNLADAKAELERLENKLKHTPDMESFKGKDYVRVVPDSETSFTDQYRDSIPGRYAEVWHKE